MSGIKEEIKQNDRVEYDEQEGKKGLNAVKVKRLSFIEWFSVVSI
jgi:cold shock protein